MNGLGLKNDLLRLLYIEDATALSGAIADGLEEQAVTAVNQAFQEISLSPHGFIGRKHYTFTTVAGTATYTLDQDLQDILGPVKLNGATPHISPIKDRGDFDNYATRFKGALTNSQSNALPEAYFLERLWQDAADSTLVRMIFTPTPDDAYSVDFEARIEAPVITLADLDAAIDLPVPHNYVQSALLPIARMHMTRSHFFMSDKRPNELAAITTDYQAALVKIGLMDPQLPEDKAQPLLSN